jgi:uncharacterized protein (DUF2236 family)
MTTAQIRERVAHQPFDPPKVRLGDGVQLEVPSGDPARLQPHARTSSLHRNRGSTEVRDVRPLTAVEPAETP